ncbi:MAG: hypothetical protein QXX56_03650 [Candidatus Bathyarchaeia archaeon]
MRKDKEMLVYPATTAGIIFVIILTFIVSFFYNILLFIGAPVLYTIIYLL